jgi:hypothetical protein
MRFQHSILKPNPATCPSQQAANLKTAKELGLTVRRSLLAIANEVVEPFLDQAGDASVGENCRKF